MGSETGMVLLLYIACRFSGIQLSPAVYINSQSIDS